MTRSLPRVAALGAVALLLAAAAVLVARASDPAGAARGAVDVVEDVDRGVLHVLLDGGKGRIQQPATFVEEELDGLGVRLAPAAVRLVVSDQATGSRFVVMPPDGPEARLHLLVDDVLHPIEVGRRSAEVLDALPDVEVPYDRFAPAG